MIKRERSAENNGKVSHLSSLVKLQPWFLRKTYLRGRTAALVPEFAVKDLPLGRIL